MYKPSFNTVSLWALCQKKHLCFTLGMYPIISDTCVNILCLIGTEQIHFGCLFLYFSCPELYIHFSQATHVYAFKYFYK